MHKSNPNLAGIKIAHDLEDFQENQEIVLTLADKQILQGNELEEEVDVLENYELKDKFENEFYSDLKKKLKSNTFNYVEDRYNQEKKLLPHYDEMKPEKKGIFLGEEGVVDTHSKLDAIRKKLKISDDKSISLESERKIATEYETCPPPKFKRPLAKKDKKQTQDLINFLEESMPTENVASQDRPDILSLLQDEETQQLERSLEKQRKLIQLSSKVEDVVKSFIDLNKKAEEETSLMQKEGLSKLTIEMRRKEEGGEREAIKTIVNSTEFLKGVRTEEEFQENQLKISISLPPPTSYSSSAPQTSSTKLSIKDSKEGITSVVNVPLPSEKLLSSNRSVFKPLKKEEDEVDGGGRGEGEGGKGGEKREDGEEEEYREEDLEEKKEEIEEELVSREEPYGMGLAVALKKLRERGDLELKDEDYSGRTKDKLPHEELAKFGPAPSDKIRLEYRDHTGKLMTQKEAFRYMCWTFHGKKPSKRKQEKKKKKEQMTMNPRIKNVGETPLMKAFSRVQTNSEVPYVILSQTKQDGK